MNPTSVERQNKVLEGLLVQIKAQERKHVAASCTVEDVAIDRRPC
jgi:hypothetical protein